METCETATRQQQHTHTEQKFYDAKIGGGGGTCPVLYRQIIQTTRKFLKIIL